MQLRDAKAIAASAEPGSPAAWSLPWCKEEGDYTILYCFLLYIMDYNILDYTIMYFT